jgi:hypothetical protein
MLSIYKRCYYEKDFKKVKGLNLVYEYKKHEYIVYRPFNGFTVESEKKQHELEQYKIDKMIKSKKHTNKINAEDDLKSFFDLIE